MATGQFINISPNVGEDENEISVAGAAVARLAAAISLDTCLPTETWFLCPWDLPDSPPKKLADICGNPGFIVIGEPDQGVAGAVLLLADPGWVSWANKLTSGIEDLALKSCSS